MIFTTLKAENLLSYEHLDFEFEQRGLILVSGKNGSGKSSVFDILSWCLFGVTLKCEKGDDVIATFAQKNSIAELTIELEDKSYIISRYRKHSEHKNELRLSVNGEDITSFSNDTTQIQVESILGMDHKLFTNSILFAQGRSEFFASLADKEQKEMIEMFMDNTKVDEARKRTVELLATIQDQLYKLERDHNNLETKIESKQEYIIQLHDSEEGFEQDRENELDSVIEQLSNCIENIKVNQRAKKQLDNSKQELEEIIVNLRQQKESRDKICNSCNQPLRFKDEDKLQESISALNQVSMQLHTTNTMMNSLMSNKGKLNNQVIDIKERKNVYGEQIEKLGNQIQNLEGEDYELLILLEQLRKDETELKFWDEGFGPKGIKSFMFDDIVPEFNQYVAKYLDVLSDGTIKSPLSTTSTLKSGQSREKFSFQIDNSSGGKTFKSSSAGEKRCINLSTLWSLQDMSRNRLPSPINISVLDEALDTLDAEHVEAVMSILNEHSKDRAVYVITHNDSLKCNFDIVYECQKRNKKSGLIRV